METKALPKGEATLDVLPNGELVLEKLMRLVGKLPVGVRTRGKAGATLDEKLLPNGETLLEKLP